jgi:hypothetical protein
MSDSTAGAVFEGFVEEWSKSAVSNVTVDRRPRCTPTSTCS